MKKIITLFVFTLLVVACSRPTEFSDEAKTEPLISLDKKKVVFGDILDKHKGKKVLLDFWASWCGDCIKTLPALKALQKQYPDISYVFVSLDKDTVRWKKALLNYQIKGDHYFMPSGKKGPIDDFLNLWWVPRYVVVNELGEITLFKAKKITDKNIEEALKKK